MGDQSRQLRSNVLEQLRWLGSCQTWAQVFGGRLDVEALKKRCELSPASLEALSLEKDWRPLWSRAQAGLLHGGEVEERKVRRARPATPCTASAPAPTLCAGTAIAPPMAPTPTATTAPTMAVTAPGTSPAVPTVSLASCASAPSPQGAWRPAAHVERRTVENADWAKAFPWDQAVDAALPRFHVPAFRPQQREAINACLADRDVFVRMPTGGGKSLVYQIPAVVKPLVVVISPLLALIHDQVQELIEMGVQASAVRSRGDDSGDDLRTVTKRMMAEELQIVYVTPEMIHQSSAFQKALRRLDAAKKLQRFVIDEAHCLSLWGNEFRESYLQLKNLKISFPNVPILACSATATQEIIDSVVKQLHMEPCSCFLSPVDRPNLEFKVLPKNKRNVVKDIAEVIQKIPGSGIIYCLSRQNCEDVQKELEEMRIRAEVYHAHVPLHQRAAVQQRWKSGETPIIVATIAFGMGVNKRDVRFVIHHSFPKSLEGYYQEAGRAGRDGRHATCIIFYDYEDKKRHQNMAIIDSNQAPEYVGKSMQRLLQMVAYCESTSCRRAFIVDYFQESEAQARPQAPRALCGRGCACDICAAGGPAPLVEVTREAQMALQLLRARQERRGDAKMAPKTLHSLKDALLGSKGKRFEAWSGLPNFGSLSQWTEPQVLQLLRLMVIRSVLAEDVVTGKAGHALAYLVEGRYGAALLGNAFTLHLAIAQAPPRNRNRKLSKDEIQSARAQASRPRLAVAQAGQAQPVPQNFHMPNHPAQPVVTHQHMQQLQQFQPSPQHLSGLPVQQFPNVPAEQQWLSWQSPMQFQQQAQPSMPQYQPPDAQIQQFRQPPCSHPQQPFDQRHGQPAMQPFPSPHAPLPEPLQPNAQPHPQQFQQQAQPSMPQYQPPDANVQQFRQPPCSHPQQPIDQRHGQPAMQPFPFPHAPLPEPLQPNAQPHPQQFQQQAQPSMPQYQPGDSQIQQFQQPPCSHPQQPIDQRHGQPAMQPFPFPHAPLPEPLQPNAQPHPQQFQQYQPPDANVQQFQRPPCSHPQQPFDQRHGQPAMQHHPSLHASLPNPLQPNAQPHPQQFQQQAQPSMPQYQPGDSQIQQLQPAPNGTLPPTPSGVLEHRSAGTVTQPGQNPCLFGGEGAALGESDSLAGHTPLRRCLSGSMPKRARTE